MWDADYAVVLLAQNSPHDIRTFNDRQTVESKRQRTNWLSLGQTEARTEEDFLKKIIKESKKEGKKERKERRQT